MTLKAVRVLAECDVVLYDRLVGKDVLRYARPEAELIYVGKRKGEQERTQHQIFELITAYALAGKTVGRLKGGDPLVFGRGAEEWALAVEQGIDVELVPGVSSAIAVPGLAGIPLTYRGVSQSFAVITAHRSEGQPAEWDRYTNIDTLVVLMGVKNRDFIAQSLLAAGRNEQEPVAFVERGTLPQERVVVSTLGAVARSAVAVRSPAVFVIGEAVTLISRLTRRPPAQ